jgi:hypothetical protein
MIFGRPKTILIFLRTCTLEKDLCYVLAGATNFSFCHVFCTPICLVFVIVLQSNIKHRNAGVFLYYPSFFSKSYASLELLILSFFNLLIYNLNIFIFSQFLYLPSSIPFSSPTRTLSPLRFSQCMPPSRPWYFLVIDFVLAPSW